MMSKISAVDLERKEREGLRPGAHITGLWVVHRARVRGISRTEESCDALPFTRPRAWLGFSPDPMCPEELGPFWGVSRFILGGGFRCLMRWFEDTKCR
jgi:hypothetical protein